MLFTDRYRLALFVGSLLQLCNVMGGYFALIYFSTRIFQSIGDRSEHGAIKVTIMLGIIDLLATAFYAAFSDSNISWCSSTNRMWEKNVFTSWTYWTNCYEYGNSYFCQNSSYYAAIFCMHVHYVSVYINWANIVMNCIFK